MAHPHVQAFQAACYAHGLRNGLTFTAAGMNEMFDFAKQWLQDHGPLPDSGVQIG